MPERRLHDARHTAATVLLGVPDRAVMDVMGWAQVTMAKRYQHITSEPTTMIADQVGGCTGQPTRVLTTMKAELQKRM